MRYRATFAVCLSFVLILPSAGGEPILIAHRGMLRHAPENTMPALATCIELSFGFELDVYSSRDNRLVVVHNEKLQGTTNGPNRICPFSRKDGRISGELAEDRSRIGLESPGHHGGTAEWAAVAV